MKKITKFILLLLAFKSFTVCAQHISAGENSSFYTCTSAFPMAAGDNGMGQLGDGTSVEQDSPVTISGITDAVAISNKSHTLFIKSDSTVWSCGQNFSGQLGDGTTTNRSIPVQVIGLTGIIDVKAGSSHSLFLKSDGTVWSCGHNANGELGDGTTTDRSTPVQVIGLTNVVAIAAGIYHSLYLKSDGTVWGSGYNYYSQLGVTPGSTSPITTPVQATALSGITAIAAGGQFSIFVKNDGTFFSSGNSNYGMNAGSSLTTASTTLTNVSKASIGLWHCTFLKNDGTAWGSGLNYYGELGDGTNIDSGTTPVQVSGLTGVTEIATGNFQSLFLKNDGAVWACGRNDHGQLGNGSHTNSNLPIQVNGLCSGSAGVQENVLADELNLFPNPAVNAVNITSSETETAMVKIYNVAGQIVFEKQIAFQSKAASNIDVQDLNAGVYFVKIQTGKNIKIQKLIKQNN